MVEWKGGTAEMDEMNGSKRVRLKSVATVLVGIVLGCALFVGVVYLVINQHNGKIVSYGQVRKYLLYVPDSYDPSTPTPLVISLHGFAEWPAHIRSITGWNDLADEHGLIVVYPSGTKFPKRWSTDSNSRRPEDPLLNVTFIADLIDALSLEYNIDQNRVYANGFSNGGGMAFLLACELADRIAAIGGVASADYYQGEECQPSRPVPVIAFHGTEDNFVSYYGRWRSPKTYQKPRVPKWIEAWAARYQCSPEPVELPSGGEVSGVQYLGCDQEAEVHFYTIEGGGHAWPGGKPMPEFIVGHTTEDIDATRVMWAFFSQFFIE
jgi:polyhydroxybutyrate depolymerase